jgi:hypothetical protein
VLLPNEAVVSTACRCGAEYNTGFVCACAATDAIWRAGFEFLTNPAAFDKGGRGFQAHTRVKEEI